MDDIYKSLFYGLLVVLAVVLAVLFGVLFSFGAEAKFLNGAGQVGSILGGLGGAAAAACAVLGLSAWRQQLLAGKRLHHLWDAQVSIRKYLVVLREVNLYAGLLGDPSRKDFAEQALPAQVSAAIAMQRECMASCSVVDVVVEDCRWVWSPRIAAAAEYWIDYHSRKTNAARSGEAFDVDEWSLVEGKFSEIAADLKQLIRKHTEGG